MISEMQLPTEATETIKSKRATDVQINIKKSNIEHKRISLPINALKVNKEKGDKENMKQLKKFRKLNKTVDSSESIRSVAKQNKPLKSIRSNHSNINQSPLKKIVTNKKTIVKSKPQSYLSRPIYNDQHSSLTFETVKAQSTHLNTSHQSKNRLINTNDSLSKHQII